MASRDVEGLRHVRATQCPSRVPSKIDSFLALDSRYMSCVMGTPSGLRIPLNHLCLFCPRLAGLPSPVSAPTGTERGNKFSTSQASSCSDDGPKNNEQGRGPIDLDPDWRWRQSGGVQMSILANHPFVCLPGYAPRLANCRQKETYQAGLPSSSQ